MERYSFNDNWFFLPEWQDGSENISKDQAASFEAVRLPHTVKQLPFNSFDQDLYQTVSTYLRFFTLPEAYQKKRVFVRFEGAGHQAEVWCNGVKLGCHRNGYTGFSFELTGCLRFDEENLLCVKLDSREADVPPFGGVIDYLTYGGLYRDVWLECSDESLITDVFIRGKADGSFRCSVESQKNITDTLCLDLYDSDGRICYSGKIGPDGFLVDTAAGIEVWNCDAPVLYQAVVTLRRGETELDRMCVRFGFRDAEFRKDGFYLNGEKVLIRGLDRHQCWPYLGYAVPARPQRLDAEILKYELGCNAVRTSHYPQSRHFIDRCDEIGLLVFMELPGWQHIGDAEWQAQAVQNVREMVTEFRNHPSIILWGVRINESRDNDAFYEETNRTAHELDDSRCTGGVRNFRGSHLLEDVYTYNDFSHCGWNAGCEPKEAVTSEPDKPYLVTEYCGHIFPTKPFDTETHRVTHALRHARVINDIAAQKNIAGSFGWCMFDYNTHREFGSGDGICWHGVMDIFRNPKLAAAVYASQSDREPVLEFSSTMDIGEYPAFMLTSPVAFTNADEVRLYRSGVFVKSFFPSPDYAALPHPPVFVDDLIGCLLESAEGYDAETAADLKTVIYAFVRYAEGPMGDGAKAAKKRLNEAGISDDVISALQNRYMTYWGEDRVVVWRLDALKGNKIIASGTLTPGRKMSLCVNADATVLHEDGSWDMASLRISVRDEHGNIQTYCQRALRLSASGAVELVGPDCIPLTGGMTGCYVKTRGIAGEGKLSIRADGIDPVEILFTVTVG